MNLKSSLLLSVGFGLASGYAMACEPPPNDSEVLTCRYESRFTKDNCADFPMAHGWTEESVLAFCQGQSGAKPETVVISQQDSCLVTVGATETANRCEVVHEETMKWYGYGVPAYICTNFVKGTHAQGPFCSDYEVPAEEGDVEAEEGSGEGEEGSQPVEGEEGSQPVEGEEGSSPVTIED